MCSIDRIEHQIQTDESKQVSLGETQPRPSVFLLAIFRCNGLRASDGRVIDCLSILVSESTFGVNTGEDKAATCQQRCACEG